MEENNGNKRVLNLKSTEFMTELEKLIHYNDRQNRIGYVSMILFIIFMGIYACLMRWFASSKFPYHMGLEGLLTQKIFPSFCIMIIILFMILYHQFDLPAVQRCWLARSPRSHENFPGVITPYLERGTDVAWDYIRHRNDAIRKVWTLGGGLCLMLCLILPWNTELGNVVKDMPGPSTTQTFLSSVYYTKNGLYTFSMDDYRWADGISKDASTETMEAAYDSYRGYPSLDFTLTEQEAKQILEPLLPKLELENGAVTTWKELKTGLQAGEYIYPKEKVKTAIPVEITGYLHSEVLCSFKVLE
jgi:hypothetical protein